MKQLRFPLLIALLALLLCGPASAYAQDQIAMEQTAVDQSMRNSLQQVFAQGIVHQGAQAELIEVTRWPETQGRLTWRLPHISRHASRISLTAEQGKGKMLRRWYVPVRVHWWTLAMVASQDIPARTLLEPSMLTLSRVDVADLNGRSWQNPAALNGTRTTRPLIAGQPVLSSSITRPPLLKHGDTITLIAHIGGVRVTATGKVLKNAGIGDRVRIQNLRSREIVQATVLDAHSARVESGGAT